MVIQSIDSAGSPVFQSVSRGQQQAETSTGENSSGQESPATPSTPTNNSDISLERQIRGQKKIEVSRDGKELVNLDVLSSDLEFSSGESSEAGLKAVMITRSQDNPSDFEVSLLRVQPDGSTRTLFQTDDIDPLQSDINPADLDFRGSLFDQHV